MGKALELDIGRPLEPIVAIIGGKIVYGGLENYGVSGDAIGGEIIANSSDNFTITLSKLTAPIRDRFTIAHELGHLFLHLPAIKANSADSIMRATRYVDNTDENQQRTEWEANWFAASLLMPMGAMKMYIDSDPEYIAARFNVSKRAAEIRLEAVNSA